MANRDIVVVGASAGGIEVLEEFLDGLPENFHGTIFIVLHLAAGSPGVLADILGRVSRLPVSTAHDTSAFESGHVYVAPADYHLLVEDGRVNVVKGPRENRVRPAIDPLFRSAALNFGPRVVGIVLTGLLDDGTSGLMAIKEAGGTAIVQDPAEASFPDMPESAIAHVEVDHVVPVAAIAQTLQELVREQIENSPSTSNRSLKHEVEVISGSDVDVNGEWGDSVPLVCPDCGGPMRERTEGSLRRLRCEVGHGYTARSFLEAKNDEVEQALAAAERTLTERRSMLERMADDMRSKNRHHAAEAFDDRAAESREQIEVIRRVLYGKE